MVEYPRVFGHVGFFVLVELMPEGTMNMRNDIDVSEAGRQYAEAYAAHYKGRDLPAALQLYLKVIQSHPNAPEAEYSREQLQNIAATVVPKQELLDAQIRLATACLEHGGPPDARRIPAASLAS